jgi:hypothetical protein
MPKQKRAVVKRPDSGKRPQRQSHSKKGLNQSQSAPLAQIAQLARQDKPRLSTADVTHLQRTLGNQAVLRMMSEAKNKGGAEVSPAVEKTIQRAQGNGRAMSPRVQKQAESDFGRDFRGVEIHNDHQADKLNDSLQARAFTSGSQIFFKQDQYRPDTAEGRQLLAHELTHVVQQGAAGLKTGGVVQRSALSDGEVSLSSAGERPLIQRSILGKIGNLFGRLAKGVKNAIRFVRNRLKQSCGGKIDAKESKKILETVFKGHKFKVDRIKVVDEAGIKSAWDKIYGKGSYDGSNGQVADGPLEGFTAPDNIIYINSTAQEVDTMPHEILHRHENGVVINQMGENFNEGFTEYLTQKAVTAMGYKPTSSYPNDLAVVKKMVPLIGGDEVLENAYFDGKLADLKLALEKKKGAGSFALLVAAMKAENYANANKILDAKGPK